MVLKFVRTIVFDMFSTMHMAYKGCIALFPALKYGLDTMDAPESHTEQMPRFEPLLIHTLKGSIITATST